MNIFLEASKQKLRFPTAIGNLSVEQLWDLPLETGTANLYVLAEQLQETIAGEKKPSKALSFFKKEKRTNSKASLQFAIVEAIVTTRVEEVEEKEVAAVNKSKKAEIGKLIEAKKAEAMGQLSLADLEKMYKSF